VSTIIGSRGKYKVLKVIYEYGEVNISRIARETGLNYAYVKRYVKELKDSGIINKRAFGRAKMYSINYTSSKAVIVRDIIKETEELDL